MKYLAFAALAASLVVGGANAAVLVDRGLPTDNLNNASGASRSNVTWGFAGDFSSGDTFTLSMDSQIDSVTTWFTTGSADPQDNFQLDSRFSDVSLYIGSASGTTVDKVATSGISGNAATGPNVSVNKVTYAGGENYEGTTGSQIQLWEVVFTDLGDFAAGDYLFSVYGTSVGNDIWFNHASNAALGGVPADGADDLYGFFEGAAGGPSLEFGSLFSSQGNGWDKASDINILVEGTAAAAPVPLPASGLLIVAGIAGFGVLRRKQAA